MSRRSEFMRGWRGAMPEAAVSWADLGFIAGTLAIAALAVAVLFLLGLLITFALS